MRQILVRVLPACLSLLFIAGCVALPPAEPVGTPSPTAPVSSAPARTSPRVLPSSTRTDVPEIDRVIDAVLTGDRAALRSLTRFLTTPCTTREGLGGPPKCATGQSEGTPVEVFPVGGPEGSFATQADLDRILPGPVAGLYAVYQAPASVNPEAYWPAGDYAAVFLNPDDTFLIVRVTGDGIVRIDHPLGSSEDLAAWVGRDAILPPAGP